MYLMSQGCTKLKFRFLEGNSDVDTFNKSFFHGMVITIGICPIGSHRYDGDVKPLLLYRHDFRSNKTRIPKCIGNLYGSHAYYAAKRCH